MKRPVSRRTRLAALSCIVSCNAVLLTTHGEGAWGTASVVLGMVLLAIACALLFLAVRTPKGDADECLLRPRAVRETAGYK